MTENLNRKLHAMLCREWDAAEDTERLTAHFIANLLREAAAIGIDTEREECAELADFVGTEYGLPDAFKVANIIRARSRK